MATFVLRLLPLVLVAGVLAIWLPHLRRTDRSPATVAICKSLAALALALVVQLAYPLLDGLIPSLPSAPHFLMHALGLFAAYWLAAVAIHLARPADSVAERLRLRAWLLAAALCLLTVLYAIGPAVAGLRRISAEEGDHAFVAHYTAVYTTYLALALIDLYWMSTKARTMEHVWLRQALRLLRIGSAVGIAYVVLRVATPLVHRAGGELPWTNAGPSGVGTYLMLAGIALIMAGIALPPLGETWDRRRSRAAPETQ